MQRKINEKGNTGKMETVTSFKYLEAIASDDLLFSQELHKPLHHFGELMAYLLDQR